MLLNGKLPYTMFYGKGRPAKGMASRGCPYLQIEDDKVTLWRTKNGVWEAKPEEELQAFYERLKVAQKQ